MTLEEVKKCVENIEEQLPNFPFVIAWTEVRNKQIIHLALTERLHKKVKKAHIWKSPHFLSTLKNVEYGFDQSHARSRGGADGIFLLERSFQPKNEMMHKIFDQYLDKENSGVEELAQALDASVEDFLAVRLVSHHMRLIGVLLRKEIEDWLVLVDFDDN
jgi:hypothetical protein